ncbi:MAG: hypothetical protein RIT81_40725 [Deltaproteobacteria bacterium]
MSDELADAVGRQVAEDQRDFDPRLERLAAGELSEAELRSLEAEAEQDPELAAALTVFRPANDLEMQRLVKTAKTEVKPRRVLPWAGAGIAAAVALAVLVPLLSSGPEPLPLMTSSIVAGDRKLRSEEPAPEGPATMQPDSELTILLRPDVATGPLDAAVFVVRDGRAERIADAPIERSDDGVTRVRATAQRLLGDRSGTVLVVVTRPGFLPTPDDVAVSGNTGTRAGPGWQAAWVEVVIPGVRAPP